MTHQPAPFVWTTPEKVSLFLNLVAYLKQHGATEVSELSRRFDISQQQVRKMVRFIGTAGVPGDAQNYSHQDMYDIDWDALELDDIAQLKQIVGVDGTPRFTSTQAATILAGLHSMRALLTDDQARIAASAEAKLRLATSADAPTLSVSEVIEPLSDALTVISQTIAHGTQLSFLYLDSDGQSSSRTLDSHQLMQLQGAWYVTGWCHTREAMRTFRVEFMTKLTSLAVAQVHPSVHASAIDGRKSTETQGVHTPGDEAQGIVVELIVAADAMYRLDSWSPIVVGSASGNRVRVRVTLIHESRVIPLVCAAPGDIEVVTPTSTRQLVSDWAESKA